MPDIVPKPIAEMTSNRNVSAWDLRVWLAVADSLNMLDFLPVKLDLVAQQIGSSKSQVFRSLESLVKLGYLERGERAGQRGPLTYRVPMRRIYPREVPRAA